MLKKLGAIFSLIIILLGATFLYAEPVFYKYSNSYDVYLGDNSSLAEIVEVDSPYFFALGKKWGESVRLSPKDFSLENLLEDFSARLVFSESTSTHQIYYAFSPTIRYQKRVKGKKVNLQIAIAKNSVVLGSPLIFGSF